MFSEGHVDENQLINATLLCHKYRKTVYFHVF